MWMESMQTSKSWRTGHPMARASYNLSSGPNSQRLRSVKSASALPISCMLLSAPQLLSRGHERPRWPRLVPWRVKVIGSSTVPRDL